MIRKVQAQELVSRRWVAQRVLEAKAYTLVGKLLEHFTTFSTGLVSDIDDRLVTVVHRLLHFLLHGRRQLHISALLSPFL